jgi:hypothetical protein
LYTCKACVCCAYSVGVLVFSNNTLIATRCRAQQKWATPATSHLQPAPHMCRTHLCVCLWVRSQPLTGTGTGTGTSTGVGTGLVVCMHRTEHLLSVWHSSCKLSGTQRLSFGRRKPSCSAGCCSMTVGSVACFHAATAVGRMVELWSAQDSQ